MNVTSFILEKAFRRLQVPNRSIRQFLLASSLSEVEGAGFPKELLQVSIPVVMRGLLNFAVLQMRDDWVYPYWVHQQLDPDSESFIARSQNPLLINVTHRNWTAVGTPHGRHEAVIDPRGLATPLPREWSVDVWLADEESGIFFPSLATPPRQTFGPVLPSVTTAFDAGGLELVTEYFASTLKKGPDVLFGSARVRNLSTVRRGGIVCVAVRPFNAEGVAPVFSIGFETSRLLSVDGSIGVVFAQAPDWASCGSMQSGDLSQLLMVACTGIVEQTAHPRMACDKGLAHALAAYRFDLAPGEEYSTRYSIALAEQGTLISRAPARTWRVNFERRKSEQMEAWKRETAVGASWRLADPALQELFEASRLALLQFNDGDFISPGAWVYHHFWFRDAATMLRALDVLGYHRRVRGVIDAFPARLTRDGFFRGPDGEWDSNGAVLWTVHQHAMLTRPDAWLSHWWPTIEQATRWIDRMQGRTVNGLMPKSLSAEHFGLTDQYYWDSFWSLAGLRAASGAASLLGNTAARSLLAAKADGLERNILAAMEFDVKRLEKVLIPAGPGRPFDASAIGSLSCIYPLDFGGAFRPFGESTVRELRARFVRERGFYHPIIHSGYNPYLTMHVAHSLLLMGDVRGAWDVADTLLHQAKPPYSFPEAMHPRSGGGSMGDGHHGWAAAEILLFLRDCIVNDRGAALALFEGNNGRLVRSDVDASFHVLPTRFGAISCSLRHEGGTRVRLTLDATFHDDARPECIDVHLPFPVASAIPFDSAPPIAIHHREGGCMLRCNAGSGTYMLER
jgi:hypothetical protein